MHRPDDAGHAAPMLLIAASGMLRGMPAGFWS